MTDTQPAVKPRPNWLIVAEVFIVAILLVNIALEIRLIVENRSRPTIPAQWVLEWGGPGLGNGRFNGPQGIAVDSAGRVYVADLGNRRVQVFTNSGQLTTEWLGSGPQAFAQPSDVAVGPDGIAYVVDAGTARVYKFQPDGGPAGIVETAQYGTYSPRGITVDEKNIYLADTGNGRVLQLGPDGRLIGAWGGVGREPGKFNEPFDLAVDASGNIFVADKGNKRVQKLSPEGSVLAVWNVAGAVARLAVDHQGRLYVTDPENRTVWLFDNTGKVIGHLVDIQDAKAFLAEPQGIAVDSRGNIFVASDNRIVVLSIGR